ncbi:MAG: hypothetical protein HW387_572 [Parachlamydiales bacterium]|nr:hypothetical protein [Parachlamydiales bacterium]
MAAHVSIPPPNHKETQVSDADFVNNRKVTLAVVVGTAALVSIVASCLLFIPGAPLAALGAIISGTIGSFLGISELAATFLITGITALPLSIIAVIAIAKRIFQPTSIEIATNTDTPQAVVKTATIATNTDDPDTESLCSRLSSPLASPASTVVSFDNTQQAAPNLSLDPNEPRVTAERQTFLNEHASNELKKLFLFNYQYLDTHLDPHDEALLKMTKDFDEFLYKLMPPNIDKLEKSGEYRTLKFKATYSAPHEMITSIPIKIFGITLTTINIKITMAQEILAKIIILDDCKYSIIFEEQQLMGSLSCPRIGWLATFIGETESRLTSPHQLTQLIIEQFRDGPWLTALFSEPTAGANSSSTERSFLGANLMKIFNTPQGVNWTKVTS